MLDLTRKALEEFDNQHDFERMCADILNALGFREVVPIAPRGGPDEGRDITYTGASGRGLACVTLRKDIERKFKEDFGRRKKGEYSEYTLFCTAYLTAETKKAFTQYCLSELDAELTPRDIEALSSLLNASLIAIRDRYLRTPIMDAEIHRRSILLAKLRQKYILSHDGLTSGMLAGLDPLPKDWVEAHLKAMGETWRQERYI